MLTFTTVDINFVYERHFFKYKLCLSHNRLLSRRRKVGEFEMMNCIYIVRGHKWMMRWFERENMQGLERWRDVEQLEVAAQGPILQPDQYTY